MRLIQVTKELTGGYERTEQTGERSIVRDPKKSVCKEGCRFRGGELDLRRDE